MTKTFTIPTEAFKYARRSPDGTLEGDSDTDFYIMSAVQYLINNKKLLIPIDSNNQISEINEHLEDELDNLRYKFDKLEDKVAELSMENSKLKRMQKVTDDLLSSKINEIAEYRIILKKIRENLFNIVSSIET